MNSYCTAREAAELVKTYYEDVDLQTEKAFYCIMTDLSNQIRKAATNGIGEASFDVLVGTREYKRVSLPKLRDMLVKELTEVLGYRVVCEYWTLTIVWASDV